MLQLTAEAEEGLPSVFDVERSQVCLIRRNLVERKMENGSSTWVVQF